MIVAGVDGCRAGWVVAVAEPPPGSIVDISVVPSFDLVVDLLADSVEAIAVDIPIGLPERGRRACDRAARRLLGDRRSTVFAAPLRALLGVSDYPTALAKARAIDGKGLSKQAFFLLPKIAEVDAVISPARQRMIVESHPELAFTRLTGDPLPSKHTDEGRRARIDATSVLVGSRRLPALGRAHQHDVLDAIVLTHTAARLARGEAELLGDGEHDARGLAMEIAW